MGLLTSIAIGLGVTALSSLIFRKESDYDGKFTQDDITSIPGIVNGLSGKDLTGKQEYGAILKSLADGEEHPKEQENNYIPSLKDNTNDNIEQAITGTDSKGILNYIQQQQQEQIALQEKWRQQDFERQDTAWQRSVADMRAAGINPNLVNAQPAASGTATSQPAEKDNSIFSDYMMTVLEKIDQEYEEGKVSSQDYKNIAGAIRDLIFGLTMLNMGKK